MAERKKPSTLLVADDDPVALKLIGFNFDQAGLYCQLFETGDELLDAVGDDTLVCLLDVDMPGANGIECLESIKKDFPSVEVIMLTNLNEAAEAVQAVKAGAFDYLTKPFDPKWLVKSVRAAMQLSRQEKANSELLHSLSDVKSRSETVGDSSAIRAVQDLIARVGPSDKTVLLTGESGTGKTLLARSRCNCSRNCLSTCKIEAIAELEERSSSSVMLALSPRPIAISRLWWMKVASGKTCISVSTFCQ